MKEIKLRCRPDLKHVYVFNDPERSTPVRHIGEGRSNAHKALNTSVLHPQMFWIRLV